MKKLNNKGYMLIEIILAVGLAMGIGYFLIELTLKVKNTNDDLLVESLVKTDQGIIYNMIMKDVYENANTFNNVKDKINVTGNRITYNDQTIIVTDYAKVEGKNIDETNKKITIPIKVKQLPDENFDIVMYFVD